MNNLQEAFKPYDIKSYTDNNLNKLNICNVCGYEFRDKLYDGKDTMEEFGSCPKCYIDKIKLSTVKQ